MPPPRRKRAKKTDLDGRHLGASIKAEATPRVEGPYRRVKPYLYRFQCYTKGRWIGRTLLDVFVKEFRANDTEYYEQAIRTGLITVNGQIVDTDFTLENNQLITNCVHRHEPPVTSAPIEIVHECDRFLAVDKPASIPVHPCGRYRHNTVLALLGHEYDKWDLHTCHRLDRLTSGVLLLAKTKDAAQTIERELKSRDVQKEYICKVEGRFPRRATCSEPIRVVSHRLGLCTVDPSGKSCRTDFERLAYDEQSNCSIVTCWPKTGRMHQIRVHLKFLGHPIMNDPLYSSRVWRPGSRAGDVATRLAADLYKSEEGANPPAGHATARLPQPHDAASGIVPGCSDCAKVYPDPQPHEMCLFLHARRFKCSLGTFETELPAWAHEVLQRSESTPPESSKDAAQKQNTQYGQAQQMNCAVQ